MSGNGFVGFNNSVFLAEKEVADRNYALAYYMKENKCFPKGTNIKSCLEFWYQVRTETKKPNVLSSPNNFMLQFEKENHYKSMKSTSEVFRVALV